MEHLVFFHESVDSLSTAEYQQFLGSIQRETLTTLLFFALRQELYYGKRNRIQRINGIIKNIKSKRSKKDTGDTDNNEQKPNDERVIIKLDDLPYSMLSQISSYLTDAQQTLFEHTARTIFIGVRSSKVHHMSLHSASDHMLAMQFVFERHQSVVNHNIETALHGLKLMAKYPKDFSPNLVMGIVDEIVVKYKELLKDMNAVVHQFGVITAFRCVSRDLSMIEGIRIVAQQAAIGCAVKLKAMDYVQIVKQNIKANLVNNTKKTQGMRDSAKMESKEKSNGSAVKERQRTNVNVKGNKRKNRRNETEKERQRRRIKDREQRFGTRANRTRDRSGEGESDGCRDRHRSCSAKRSRDRSRSHRGNGEYDKRNRSYNNLMSSDRHRRKHYRR
eukprot:996665_1